jgi:signal transduction histidine kinase
MQSMPLQTDTPMPIRDLSADPFVAGRASLRLEALGLMTAGIVHDLGNIIQILSSSVDVVEQHPTIKATKALRPTVARAVNSLERASVLIKQILGFARETDNKKESVDIALCLGGMERLLRWIGKDRLRIDIDVGPGAPRVVCNRWNFENAILNLALNARDATPQGGALSITAAPTRNRDHIVTGVTIRVSDTGRGMSEETMARAFDPFFTTKTGDRGTGLGLTMVRRFALEAGGNVSIESAPGNGTTVTLRLPCGHDDRARAGKNCSQSSVS